MRNPNILPTMTDENGVDLYKVKDASDYVGMSNTALRNRVNKWNAEHPNKEDKITPINFGGREIFYRKSDLDRLFTPRSV